MGALYMKETTIIHIFMFLCIDLFGNSSFFKDFLLYLFKIFKNVINSKDMFEIAFKRYYWNFTCIMDFQFKWIINFL